MVKKIILIITGLILAIVTVNFCTYDKKIINLGLKSNNLEDKNVVTNDAKNDIGTLIIEKIGLDADIKEGSTNKILKNNIGHIENTPIYDGNVGLAAHNRGNKYSYFARLNELKQGDEVFYKTRYGTRKYIIDKIVVIIENDWSMLRNTNDNKITMITCVKNQPNKRLCVQATQNERK